MPRISDCKPGDMVYRKSSFGRLRKAVISDGSGDTHAPLQNTYTDSSIVMPAPKHEAITRSYR